MKLSFDGKFLTTALITYTVLVAVIAGVSAVAGVPVAMVAAAAVGTISVKLFDKFEYHPTSEIAFGAPLISVPLLYAALASTLVLYGAQLGTDFFNAALGGPQSVDICRASVILPSTLLDWGGFALGGWLIGRLFPQRALGLATFAGLVVLAEAMLKLRHPDPVSFHKLMLCVYGPDMPSEDLQGNEASFRVGAALGLASRTYLAIVFARFASRRQFSEQIVTAP